MAADAFYTSFPLPSGGHYNGKIIRDTNGNLYMVAIDAFNGLDIKKSTDNGDSWNTVDGSNNPTPGTDIHSISWAARVDGTDTTIGIVTQSVKRTSGMNNLSDVEFHEFDCSDVPTTGDTWVTTEDTVDTPTINDAIFNTSTRRGAVAIVARSTDWVIAYYGDSRASMGADYLTTWYARGTAASWTTARYDDRSDAASATNAGAWAGSVADDVHLTWHGRGLTLRAGNTTSSVVDWQLATGSHLSSHSAILDNGGETHIVGAKTTSGSVFRISFLQEDASDDVEVYTAKTFDVIDPFTMVTETATTEFGPVLVHDPTNGLVYALWLSEEAAANEEILGISAPDNDTETVASWDNTATVFFSDADVPEAVDAATGALLATIWDDGGSTYLGVMSLDTALNRFYFFRYELASGGLAITPAVASVAITAGGLTITTGSVPITPAVASVSATPASLTVTQASPIDPVGASVGVTPSTLVVTPGSVGVTPAPLTVSVTPSTVVLTTTVDVTLVAASVSATPSTVAVTTETPLALTGQSVAITPGTLDVVGAQAVDPVGASVSISAGGLVLTTQTPITLAAQAVTVTPGSVVLDQNVVLTGASVSVTPDSLTVTTGAVNITPTAPTVTITPGTLDVTAALSVSLVGQTVTVTPSTLEVDTAITPATAAVIVTAGGLTVAQSVTLPAPVVAVTPGTVDVTVGAAPVDPVGQTVNVSAGSMTITVGAVDITPAPVTVSVTPSTLAVTTETAVTPAPVTVNVTAGSLELDHGINIGGQTVNASPSTLVVAAGLPLEPTGQTVTVTSGTMTVTTGSVNISLDAATVAVTPSTVQVANAGEEEAGMLMMMGIGT